MGNMLDKERKLEYKNSISLEIRAIAGFLSCLYSSYDTFLWLSLIFIACWVFNTE